MTTDATNTINSFQCFMKIHHSVRFLFVWLFVSTAIFLFSLYVAPVLEESVIYLQTLGVFVLLSLIFDYFYSATNSMEHNVFPKISESVLLLLWLAIDGTIFYFSGYNLLSSLMFISMAVVGFYAATKAVLT